jgi:hypothetical protein
LRAPTSASKLRPAILLVLFILVAIQAVAPIRSYDFFWHLATGRWIVEHHALPAYDPFTLAAAHVPWINGEWLWEAGAYAITSIVGLKGVSWINALFVGALFATAFAFSSRERDFGTAAFATAVAFAGGGLMLGIRPSEAAAFLIVVAIGILDRRASVRTTAIAYAIVTIVWINVHPSALLAPLIAATVLISDWRRWPIPLASAAALLINPFGWKAVAAPVQLTQLIGSGEFLNAEWLPSTPDVFPVLFATIAGIVILNLFARPKREDLWRTVIFIGLAVLAVKHVRNQGLYFAALPLLIPRIQLRRQASYVLAALAIFPIAAYRADRKRGIDDERFPVRAVARLTSLGLKGNIYNVDQFGGYLEWTFYPERRVLTDGRNELFRDFIALDAKARQDSRAWHEMQKRYNFDLAVDEYGKERVQVVDVATGEHRFLPPSLVRYRRRDWALIAFDDAAMIFARRSAFPADVIERAEYQYIVPDDPFIGYLTPEFREGAKKDIERARREIGDVEVVKKLDEGTKTP